MMIVQRGRSPDRSSAPRSYRERSRSPQRIQSLIDAWNYADNVHHRRRRPPNRRTDERDRRRRRHEDLPRDSLAGSLHREDANRQALLRSGFATEVALSMPCTVARALEADRRASYLRTLDASAAVRATEAAAAAATEAARGAALAAAVNRVLDVPAPAVDVPAPAEDDAAGAIPWGINVYDWRRQRDAEAARQRYAQIRHADADAVAANANADDGAAPFAMDVPAYYRQLASRQRNADALAAIAAADVRNRAEIVDHPLDASARLAEIAAARWIVHQQEHDDYHAARHANDSRADAVVASQQQRDQLSVANIDDATRFEARRAAAGHADAAAAEDEPTAADIALWEHAHHVSIVDGNVVAMWDHLPGLQDDAASAADDVLAQMEAEALVTQLELEAIDIVCGVCMDAKDLQVLACGHSFCRKCVRTLVTPVCPNCRRPL